VKISVFWKGFIFVLAAVLLVSGVVFVNRIVLGDAFNREEAQHALYSLWLWRDIHAGDWAGFWHDTQRQMVWPFLHSWILSVFFFIFGVSYVSARFLSLVFFLGTIVLIYLLSNKLCDIKGWRVGIVAVLLALTSPIMIRFASENMIEGLGALLFLSAAYLYVISEERKITIEYVFLGILIALSIYTNYLYAYLLIPAFLVMTLKKLGPLTYEAIQLRRRGEEKAIKFIWWSYRKLIVLGIILITGGLWFGFSFSRKVMLLFASIFKYSGGTQVHGLIPNLLYYPRVIIENLSFSPWLGLFILAAIFLPRFAACYQGLHRLYIYVWTVLLLLTLTIPTKAPQLIYIIVPFVFIIFAGAAVYLYDWFKSRDKNLAIGFVLVLLLPALISSPRAYHTFFPARAEQNLVQVLDYFRGSIPEGAQIGTIINLQRFNPDVVQFHFRNWEGHFLTESFLREGDIRGGDVYYLTLKLDNESPYKKDVMDDTLYRWNAWLQHAEMEGRVQLLSSRRFEDIGVTAQIYRNLSPGM
jgi:hypothetical protein